MREAIKQKNLQRQKQFENLTKSLQLDRVLLTEERLKILDLKPIKLLTKLKSGEISAIETLQAFQAKALEVNKKTNCVTEFIPEAIQWALDLDKLSSASRGPLHGLPVTIKDSINVSGMDSTLGLAANVFKPAVDHAVIVQVLLAKGAVPFAKSNIPQTLINTTCSNPVYGRTHNLLDSSRTPGGSSGGEGVLIASGASYFGIGTDVGGSVRIPAAFSGCVALKTGGGRISRRGDVATFKGMPGVIGLPGFMAHDISILTEGIQAVLDGPDIYELDNVLGQVPWNSELIQSDKKFKIGYYKTLEIFPTTPGIQRAVEEAKLILEKCGHTLVEFNLPDPELAFKIALSLLQADEGKTIREMQSKEIDPEPPIFNLPDFPKFILKLIYQWTSPLRLYQLNQSAHKSIELWKALAEREAYISSILSEMNRADIDLILSPSFAYPACPYDVPNKTPASTLYTLIWNLCDFPAGIIPVTRETEDDQRNLKNYPTFDKQLKTVKEATKGATGQPLAVQFIGKPFSEETILKVMKDLETQGQNHNDLIGQLNAHDTS